ncbi:hydroxyacylglutathione hydrolase [Enterococcus phage vB_Efm_LG62]|uniref:Hydroxyacylglutathione hydrolase n=1 Tax=Enterococcus phage vB_Efm_LG62 TaxID=2970334 RepID=A0A976SG98_9CAUD|nr:hydroxyacylglutathione hydrolase [Enterococcus phage vB_Efm_LG62]
MKEFKYEIHFSGSKGNSASIYYDNLGFLIDIGKPYKYIEPYLYDKQFVFITHKHQDHLVYTTYKKIKENFPHIQILGNADVNEQLIKRKLPKLDIIFKDDFQFKIGDVKFTTLQNYHGAGEEYVETHGFILESPSQNLIYATDLSTLVDYETYLLTNNLKLDIILLEANYDPQVIGFYEATKQHTGYSIFSSGSYRHLSTIDRELFVDKFAKPGAINVELHQSETYRNFYGLIKKSKGKITQKDVDNWLVR